MTIPGASPALYNEDLAPAKVRNWGPFSIFNVWTSDVHSLWGYYLAASLFLFCGSFLNFLIAIGIGSLIIYLLMNMVGVCRRQHRRTLPRTGARLLRHLGRQLPGDRARHRRLLLVRRADGRRLGRHRRAAHPQRRHAGLPSVEPYARPLDAGGDLLTSSSGRCNCSSSSAEWKPFGISRTGPGRPSG